MKDEARSSYAPRADGENRYTLERRLGQGAMGVVHMAWDNELGEYVALKQLSRVDADGVARLKREFRALANISHPNLVKLYDLSSTQGQWFFTMEYVDGVDLLSYVRRGDRPLPNAGERRAGALANVRLRDAFHQLASGVRALHRAGKLHRDLKPANVLVAQHRVVVLDFGLVHEISEAREPRPANEVWGTPEYMAPEQADGTLSEAADWYAFGTMLYEALTGQVPFRGDPLSILLRKQHERPTPPRELVADVPPAIDTLCCALLHADPAQRPSGAEILALLDDGAEQTSSSAGERISGLEAMFEPRSFVGRGSDLAFLRAAYERCASQQASVVHVRGASGAGKSALVEHFLRSLEEDPPGHAEKAPLILRGRCYEREALPFKALDSVMDALVVHLSRLDDAALAAVLPPDVELLAQLFPALTRITSVQALRVGSSREAGTRQRAARAALEMLTRLAAHTPIVIWIDDLQWGDADSAALLRGFLHAARGSLLFVLSYRAEEMETSVCLKHLLRAADEGEVVATQAAELSVSALGEADLCALIRERLGKYGELSQEQIEELAREAQGSPFLALQLSALMREKLSRGSTDLSHVSVENLVTELNGFLPSAARQLLAILSVAGRPLPPALALDAAGIRDHGRAHVHSLRALNLVRTREVAGERLLEVYHDRVRESALLLLPPARLRRLHKELLRTLEESGRSDPYWLHLHASGAKNRPKAYRYAREAAERAIEALAFDRAVHLYRECLTLAAGSNHEEGLLWRKLADALTCAGRGVEAARAYLKASEFSSGPEAVLLKRLAASHLVRSGSFGEGEELVDQVLSAMNARLPRSDAGLVLSIVWERIRLAVRGVRYKKRAEQEIAPAQLQRIDAFHALREETVSIHPLRSALFQSRQLRWALEAGEPKRVITALCGAALGTAVTGSASSARQAERMLVAAQQLSQEIDLPLTHALVTGHRAMCDFMFGRFEAVLEPARAAERMFFSLPGLNPEGWYYQRLALLAVRLGSLAALGEYELLRQELTASLREVRQTDNRGAVLQLALIEAMADDAAGHPERAIARLSEQHTFLPPGRFGILHAINLIAVLVVACATERFELGLDCLRSEWSSYARSVAYRVATFRGAAHAARAQLLLNHHVQRGGTGSPRGLIADDLRILARTEGVAHMPHRLRYQARLDLLSGHLEEAVAKLQQSAAGFELACMRADAQRNRYAIGRIIGGDAGAQACREAEAFLIERGLHEPRVQLARYFPELHR